VLGESEEMSVSRDDEGLCDLGESDHVVVSGIG
jgi:hypothetical protein